MFAVNTLRFPSALSCACQPLIRSLFSIGVFLLTALVPLRILAVPPAPTNAPTVVANNSAVTVTFPAVPGATKYTVYRDTILSSSIDTATCTDVTYGLSCTTSVLNNGRNFRFKYAAGDASGYNATLSPASAAAQPRETIPTTPRELRITSWTGTSLTLAWTAPAYNPVSQYRLYWSTTRGATGTAISLGSTVLTYTHSGLTAGTTYYYRLSATNAAGASILHPQPPFREIKGAPLAAPTGLTAGASVDGPVALTWAAPAGSPTLYNVKRANFSGSCGVFTKVGNTTNVSYSDGSTTPGSSYCYAVSAWKVSESANSVAIVKKLRPKAPTGVVAAPASAQVNLTWSAAAGAASYTLKRGTVMGTYPTTIPLGNVLAYADTGLVNGTRYRYVISATNVAGTSIDSLERSAVPGHVARLNSNNSMTNVTYIAESIDGSARGKQMFMNNLAQIHSVGVLLEGWGAATSETVRIRLGPACAGGTSWSQVTTAVVDLVGKCPPYWATITLSNPLVVTHGNYYILEAATQGGAKLGVNNNVYQHGRRVFRDLGPIRNQMVRFANLSGTVGQKKQDLMFVASGYADPATAEFPIPTTNRACPETCVMVNASENAPGGNPANALNVLITEMKKLGPGNYQAGSFYNDDIPTLKTAILEHMLEAPSENYRSINYIAPFSSWYSQKMNFYIAREDPTNDPESLRGFLHCANIDVMIDVVTNSDDVSGSDPGGFQGTIENDPRLSDAYSVVSHEVFGHGFGLDDEYACFHATCSVRNLELKYTFNSAPLGSSGTTACSDPTSAVWCASSLTVDQLKNAMAADPQFACWDYSPETCAANAASCHDITGFNIAYFGTNTCIPKSVGKYNIGQGCAAGTGCYIGSPSSHTSVELAMAQPGTAVMNGQGFHSPGSVNSNGFNGLEPQLSLVLDCVFDTSNCTNYDQAACDAFQGKWDGGAPNPLNVPYLANANACVDWVSKRR